MTDISHDSVALGQAIRQRRLGRRLTLAGMKIQVGVASAGYLSDIESGRKNVPLRLLRRIAECLDTTPEALIAQSASVIPRQANPIAALEKSVSKLHYSLIELIRATDSTTRGIGLKHIVREMVRWHIQQEPDDFMAEVEVHAEAVAAELRQAIGPGGDIGPAIWLEATESWLRNKGIEVDDLEKHSRLLNDVRAMLIGPERNLLLISRRLSSPRRLFVLAREIGYRILRTDDRESRSYLYPPDQEETFDQALRDYRASCFAGALLLPRAEMERRLDEVLKSPAWNAEDFCKKVLDHYQDVATEETVMYRFGQIMRARGRRSFFLKIVSPSPGVFRLDKQLNLALLGGGAAINAGEHLCNRWLATRIINELREQPGPADSRDRLVDVQVSQFMKDNGRESDEYCGISVALPYSPTVRMAGAFEGADAEAPATGSGLSGPRPGPFVSVTVGFRRRAALEEGMNIAQDVKVVKMKVSDSCERCAEPTCLERATEAGRPVEATWLSRHSEINRLLWMD